MTRFVTIAVAAATLFSAAGPVLADDTRSSIARQTPQRVVMMCASDTATTRSFRREHGSRPVFVTAEQVLSARATGERWSTPRCMTAREHERLVQTMSSYAGAR